MPTANLAVDTLPSGATLVTRRNLMRVAGVTLVGTSVLSLGGCAAPLLGAFPQVDVGLPTARTIAGVPIAWLNGGTKPIYVPLPGSTDPVAHSVADTLFWGEQMMEHAMFIAMMLPGAELAGPRGEAEKFQRQFADHLQRLHNSAMNPGNYAAFNNSTIALTNGLAAYKRRMQAAEEAGQLHSLAWPSFFDHTANEGERFVRRLGALNQGNTTFDRAETVRFWADKMEEHSLFIAHMLDPDEVVLKKAAEASADTFAGLEQAAGPKDAALAAAQTIINFKVAAQKGINSGQIKSIIHPSLADHVRREAVRFKDEVERSA